MRNEKLELWTGNFLCGVLNRSLFSGRGKCGMYNEELWAADGKFSCVGF